MTDTFATSLLSSLGPVEELPTKRFHDERFAPLATLARQLAIHLRIVRAKQ